MKKLLFSFIIILAGCLRLSAQQDHHYTMFMYNKMLYNPAYAGARNVPSITAIYRNQWMGFDGAPQSGLVSFNSPFFSDRFGIGVVTSYRKIGLQRDVYTSAGFSYELIKVEKVSIRAGVQGVLRSLNFAFSDANPIDPDPSIANESVSSILGNAGAGIYGVIDNRFYVGLSVPRLIKNKYGEANSAASLLAQESPHFYAMAGGIFKLSEDINLMPAVLFKYVEHAPLDADINVSLDIRQKVTAGMSYRVGGDGSGESIDLLVLWQATPQFGVGAAYDFTLSDLKDYNSGSIELLVQADLKKQKKKNVFSPRFFL